MASDLNVGNYLTGYIVNVTIIQCNAVWFPWLVSGVKQVELQKSENISNTSAANKSIGNVREIKYLGIIIIINKNKEF
jgi:hypothetical protein